MASGQETSDFSTPESALESSEAESDGEFDDPLGAYLEDFEDDEEQLVGDEEQDSEDEGLVRDQEDSHPQRDFSDDEEDDIIEDVRFDAEEEFVAASDLEAEAHEPMKASAPLAMRDEGNPSKKRLSLRNISQGTSTEVSREPGPSHGSVNQKPHFERDESRSWRAEQRHNRRREQVVTTSPREAPPSERSAMVRDRAIQQSVENEGLLHGWLVNFSDPKGVGYELREGKFFVSHTPLKANDFVLSHPSVSTPHALMTLSDEYGLLVQDLMSETGVFVRREGDAIYRKEEEAVILGHGDWIRFGEEEFLVTLIPSLPRG
ncbi:MAG: FHA domain-containing protein [Bdellovibrionota bacterium]|jgi:hypothetical protein